MDRPILRQLALSHYNEKARWALDHKRIPHTRRSLLPGAHAAIAARLTGGTATTPVLTLDGHSIGDSTRIIAALEERWPDPPLYPADPVQRERALALEEFFDEELGPHIRRIVYGEVLNHPRLIMPMFSHGQPPAARLLLRAGFPALRALLRRHFRVDAAGLAASRAKTIAAMDRLEREIGPSGFLAGDCFSVADLTAAALFYPAVAPPRFPYPLPALDDMPSSWRELFGELAARPGGVWVSEMYRRFR